MKKNYFFATCPKGLEQLVEEELQKLGAIETKQTVAGVKFSGDEELGYKVCLWSRFANRILFPVGTFNAPDADALYFAANKVNWREHMGINTTFIVNFSGTSNTIKHTQFAAQKIKDAIVDQFRKLTGTRPSVDKENPMLRINAVLRKGEVTLSIDLSGESLHRRGYRLEGAAAPIKENLAAAILQRAGWLEVAKKGGSLLDPLCGSGTILIEALLMAADIAPGLLRSRFGFEGWRQYKEKIWQKFLKEAQVRASEGKKKIITSYYGFDIDSDFIRQAQANATRAGLAHFITFATQDLKQLSFDQINKSYGLCITNPPYGERLHEEAMLLPLYQLLGKKLRDHFLNWEAALLTGNPELSKNMGLRAYKKYALFNGTIPCQLLLFHLQPEWFVSKPREPAPEQKKIFRKPKT